MWLHWIHLIGPLCFVDLGIAKKTNEEKEEHLLKCVCSKVDGSKYPDDHDYSFKTGYDLIDHGYKIYGPYGGNDILTYQEQTSTVYLNTVMF